jgi:RNA polymerase sigma factor (sigma-70 family)
MMTNTEFAEAYAAYNSNTLQFLLSRGISPAQAEEVAQAAWSRGWERRESLREADKIGAWVNTIALNMLRRKMRNGKREVELNPNLDAPVRSTSIERLDASKMIGSLSEADRTLLLMHAVEGRTSEEIGEACDLSAVAVRVRLCRAKARLRNNFGGSSRRNPVCRPRTTKGLAASPKANCRPRASA